MLQVPTQLRELTIGSCLVKFPKSIGQLKFLEKIVLRAGEEMGRNMKTLPDEFCRLQSLKHLQLINCLALELLPQNFGDLTNLQHLDLSDSRNLQVLPDTFSRLLQLQYLCLTDCCTLKFRRDTLGNIPALEHVNFRGCMNLQVLPIQITRQASLRTLDLDDTSLKELPNEIGDLRNLEELKLGSDCLSGLPTSIWNLSSLTKLELWRCKNLKRLPQDDADDPTSSGVRYLRGAFEHMRNLEDLYVWDCPLCEVIPFTSVSRKVEEEETTFPKLKRFCLVATEISRISISENVCPSLSSLELNGNTHLVEVEALPKALEYLSLRGCRALKRITGLSKLAKLFRLNINGCRELEEVPNAAELTSLDILDADGCWKLKSIKGLEKLNRLFIWAGDGAILNDIQFLQGLPYSKLSERCLTTRAVLGAENRVETILRSLASQLSIHELCTVEEPSRSSYGAFKLSNIKSVIAMMVCILFKASAGDASFQICYPVGRETYAFDGEVLGREGGCISMRMFTNNSTFIKNLKASISEEQIYVRGDTRSEMEVRKGWIVMARNAEEQGKILEIWNTLITGLHCDC